MFNLELPIETGNFVDTCFVDRMVVSLHAKAVDSQNFLTGNTVNAGLEACGSRATSAGEFAGCSAVTLFTMFHQSPPSGKQIGNACGSLVFDDTAPTAFNPPGNPPAPFVGTFRPSGTFKDDGWRLSSRFAFTAHASVGDVELQCLSVKFFTRTTPPTAP
jgi:hypothetical protein